MLVFDYYGYGLNSPGAMPGERTCFEDAEIVFDYLVNDLKVTNTHPRKNLEERRPLCREKEREKEEADFVRRMMA